MTGVEILAMEEVAINFTFNWVAFFICFGAVLTIFILIGIAMSMCFDDWKQLLVGLIVGTIIGGVFGTIIGFGSGTPTAFENQYKVTITDEVSMNEFTDTYEIINQDGKIYTVRERD